MFSVVFYYFPFFAPFSGPRDHVCEQCGKTYKQKHHLVEHMKTHTEVKQWECPVCHKQVTCRQSLINHISNHHPEHASSLQGQYACHVCDKKYKVKVCRNRMNINISSNKKVACCQKFCPSKILSDTV